MFIEHIKKLKALQKCHEPMNHTPQKPKKPSRRVFIIVGKIIDRVKYGGLRPKPPLFPRHNNPECGKRGYSN